MLILCEFLRTGKGFLAGLPWLRDKELALFVLILNIKKMKQKIFILFLTLIAGVETFFASDTQVDGIWYNFDSNTKTASVTYRGSYYSNEYSGSVSIPSSITYNGITYSVTSIGERAFCDCADLTSITIPNSVTNIGMFAFLRCDGLTSIDIPNSVISIGTDAFCNCSNITSVSLGNNVTNIEYGAFLECSNLISISIPGSVTSIGESAFSKCLSLIEIVVSAENPNYSSENGVLFNKDKTMLIQYPCGKQGGYEIPNSVTNVGESAFYECAGLTSIVIPNSVISIGNAFSGCSSLPVIDNIRYADTYLVEAVDKTLSSYTIKEGTKWIGTYAFGECSALTSILIPFNVTNIGWGAFYNCNGLISVICDSEAPAKLGDYAFPNNNGMNIYVPCESKETYKSAWSDYAERIQYAPSPYTIIAETTPIYAGAVEVSHITTCDDNVTVTAVGDYGYHFTQWSDGVTDNPRSFELTQDTTFTAEFARNTYAISTKSNNSEWGITIGDTSVLYQEQVEIFATANYGYHFDHWSDYEYNANWEWDYCRSNPRTITVTDNKTYEAIFAKDVFNIVKQCDYSKGQVYGPSQARYSDEVSLSAYPAFGYHFTQWSDGVTENPRTFVITQDTTFTAEFAISTTGQCGDSLYWNYSENVLSFYGSGNMYNYTSSSVPWKLFLNDIKEVAFIDGMTSIGNYACANMPNIDRIDIPASVQTIGEYAFANINNRKINKLLLPSNLISIGAYAFADNSYIDQIDFGKSLETIGAYAFQNCTRVTTMTCLADITPEVGTDALASISDYAELYVLSSALRKYQVDENWNRFLVKALGESGELGAYTISYLDKNEELLDSEVVTLHFPQAPEIEGFIFLYWQPVAKEISGGITIQAIYEANDPTSAPAEVVNPKNSAQKLIRDGNVYILTEEKVYTITGQEVR